MSRRTFKLGMWSMTKEGIGEELKHDDDTASDEQGKNEKAGQGDLEGISIHNRITTTPFIYEPLIADQPRAIRLLTLVHGPRTDDIACTLHETTLENAGRYEALSYVWGDVAVNTPLQINDKTLHIGTNLRCALLNLRHEHEDRVLWVDAVCIDQSSDDERNQQVAVMGDIYKAAWRVLVWLRDSDPKDTPKAMAMLADLAVGALEFAANNGASTGRECMLDNIPNYMIERADVDDPLADKYRNDLTIMHLIASQWWYRAWTLQENLLAQDALVVVGQYSIEWWRFCAAVNHGFNLGVWAPLTMGVMVDGMMEPYISVQHLQRRRAKRDVDGIDVAGEVLEFLNSTRFRVATNPRDKLYALLGLVGPHGVGTSPLGIRPNYALPVSQVYQEAARQIIHVSGSLDLLGSAGPIVDWTPDPELPSWVPDWRYSKLICMPLMADALGRYRSTHATCHTLANAAFADDQRTLLLAGHEVTTITTLAPVLRRIIHRSDEYDEMIAKWEADIETTPDGLKSILTRSSVLIQLCNTIYESLIAIVPHLGIYEDWEKFATSSPPTNPLPDTSDAEPNDPLSVYWQTLCVGTYVASSQITQSTTSLHNLAPVGVEDKIATQSLFYLWRATLKPIRNLRKWGVDRMFRPLAFVGYVRKTWRNYGEFIRLLEGSYERRLARCANGYLCLVPASAEVGDRIMLARGGRVPLVLRGGDSEGREGGERAMGFVGEAYVHGIMDGEGWDEGRMRVVRVR